MPLTTTSSGRFTNLRDVLLSVHAALVNGLLDIFPSETIVFADPDAWDNGVPEQLISSSFLAVCLSDAEFPDDVQVGGGAAATEEMSAVQVHIFSNMRLDQTGQMPAVLFDENEGLLELKRRVLRAIVGADLTGDNVNPLLSQLVPVRRAAKPRKNPQGIWFLTVEFGLSFFWDLT